MNLTKLHPTLAAGLSAKSVDAGAEYGEFSVILRLRPGPIARGEIGALAHVRPGAEFRLLMAQAVTVSFETLAALTDDPGVDMIWPDLPVHTWLDEAVPLIRAPRVWDTGFTGRGVRIAVVDTGLDAAHPDFAGRIVAYRDFVEPGGTGAGVARDPNGHGTHVAGVIAGGGQASGGQYRGVAPEADLIVARVLDASGNGRTSTVMAGVEWAVDQGAHVINVSLGGPPYPSDGTDAFSLLCDAAVDHGATMCVAAGNLGPGGHTIGSPAASSLAITVGASVSQGDGSSDEVAEFSSRGPTGDGRVKPDLLFPGVGIVAPRGAGTSLGDPVDDRYTVLSGTSQATPMASGTAALLLQANPRLGPTEIKARMMRGAREIPDVEATAQGEGRGDCYNTFVSAEGKPLASSPASPSPADPGAPTGVPPESRTGCLPGAAAGLLGP